MAAKKIKNPAVSKPSTRGRKPPSAELVARAMLMVEVDGFEAAAEALGKDVSTLKRWKGSYAEEMYDTDGAYAGARNAARREIGKSCDALLIKVYRKGLRKLDEMLDGSEVTMREVSEAVRFTGDLRMTHQEIALVDNELNQAEEEREAAARASGEPKKTLPDKENEDSASPPEEDEGDAVSAEELALRKELASLHPTRDEEPERFH